jgi:putative phosphoesterase
MVRVVATLGVISDTHGLLRPEARAALARVDRIIHAGDVDDRQTLRWLAMMGEVTAVRGNCDRGSWSSALPDHDLVTVEGFGIYVVHDLAQITVDPKAAGISVVVCGHTHQPRNEMVDGVLYFNPGSAGPGRYGRPVSLGKLHVGPGGVSGEIIVLADAATSFRPPPRNRW